MGLRVELSEGLQIRLIAGVLRARCPTARREPQGFAECHGSPGSAANESKSGPCLAYSAEARWTSTCHEFPQFGTNKRFLAG